MKRRNLLNYIAVSIVEEFVMLRQPAAIAIVIVVLIGSGAVAQPAAKQVYVKVGDVTRKALVYAPATAGKIKAPVVFAFHGHGGSAEIAAQGFNYQKHWPQAITVYMQGLPIPGIADPTGKGAGWQHEVGQVGDRDLKFFDQMLARLQKDYKVDARRIYATGHSNGGEFTYLLWAVRGDTFAAVAPSSAIISNLYVKQLKPKPALHIAGEKDKTVPYDKQQKLMKAILNLNGCDSKGKPWEKQGTIYPSEGGTPFVALVHPGGHQFWEEAPKLIVRFFKEHSQRWQQPDGSEEPGGRLAEPDAAPDWGGMTAFPDFKLSSAPAAGELYRWAAGLAWSRVGGVARPKLNRRRRVEQAQSQPHIVERGRVLGIACEDQMISR